MKPDDVQLAEILSELPHLKQALGEPWIAEQQRVDPVLSRFPLSRTLRTGQLQDHVATLDRLLGAFAALPGIADWRKRLQKDGPGFREVLTELTFAALLRERGYQFAHPKVGPDFEVDVGEGQRLLVEVTTPRKVAWSDDLHNRLGLLARRFGYSVVIKPLVSGSPILETEIGEQTVSKVIHEAMTRLERMGIDAHEFEQSWDQIGARITWMPSNEPGFRGYNSPNSSPFRAFNYLVDAAREKERQLPKDQPCALVIGTNQLPFPEWHEYLRSLRSGITVFAPFDWGQFPHQVKCLILFSASYVDTHPSTVDVAVRTSDPITDTPGIARFVENMCAAGEAGRQPDPDVVALLEALMTARNQTEEELLTEKVEEQSGFVEKL